MLTGFAYPNSPAGCNYIHGSKTKLKTVLPGQLLLKKYEIRVTNFLHLYEECLWLVSRTFLFCNEEDEKSNNKNYLRKSYARVLCLAPIAKNRDVACKSYEVVVATSLMPTKTAITNVSFIFSDFFETNISIYTVLMVST